MCCAPAAMDQKAIFDYVKDAHSSPDRFSWERVPTVIETQMHTEEAAETTAI